MCIQGTLTAYIKQHKYLNEQEIAKISHQLLLQIEQIHRMGIIHRDINGYFNYSIYCACVQ